MTTSRFAVSLTSRSPCAVMLNSIILHSARLVDWGSQNMKGISEPSLTDDNGETTLTQLVTRKVSVKIGLSLWIVGAGIRA